MGVPKKRAATLQEKFGFADNDLKAPGHDAMMIWLDREAEVLVREFFPSVEAWPEGMVARVRNEADAVVRTRYGISHWPGLGEPPLRSLVLVKKVWERPIAAPNNFVVGFADMSVTVRRTTQLSFMQPGEPRRTSEFPTWYAEEEKEELVFEVKTSIPSVGELIRQIRLYQQYLPAHYIVVSPDDRFAEVLRGQSIQFVKYEPSVTH